MVKKSGYFSKISMVMDEGILLSLFDYANARHVTPDLVVEQLIEGLD
jgi:hypothetical protein